MVEEQYVTFETAKMAKEKGFNESCKCFYEKVLDKVIKWECNGGIISTLRDEFLCPTQSLLARWIREKHNIHIDSYPNASGYLYYINKTNGTLVYDSNFDGPNDGGAWNSYEEAMEVGLQKALKLI